RTSIIEPSSAARDRATPAICTTATRRRSSRPSREARDGRAPRTLGSARLVSRVRDRRSAHARTPHDSTAHSFFRPPLTATVCPPATRLSRTHFMPTWRDSRYSDWGAAVRPPDAFVLQGSLTVAATPQVAPLIRAPFVPTWARL